MSETLKGGMMMMSNSSVKNLADFLCSSSLRFVIFLRNRCMALSTREAFFFFRFDVDDFNLSFSDIKLSTCLHKRMRRPTSFSPILPMPLVGECERGAQKKKLCERKRTCLFSQMMI